MGTCVSKHACHASTQTTRPATAEAATQTEKPMAASGTIMPPRSFSMANLASTLALAINASETILGQDTLSPKQRALIEAYRIPAPRP